MLHIGALVRHNHLAASGRDQGALPHDRDRGADDLDPIVRNLGTIGGSLAHADPSGDLGPRDDRDGRDDRGLQQGRRTRDRGRRPRRGSVPEHPDADRADHRGPRPRAASPRRRDVPEDGAQGRRLRHGRRGDLPHPGERLDRRRRDRAHSVGPTSCAPRLPSRLLAGASPGEDAWAEAARLAAEASEPVDDVRGSADYKRHVVDVRASRGPRPRPRWPARPEPGGEEDMETTFTINGTERSVDVEPRRAWST